MVAAPESPVATPAERLQIEFRLYLRQERALAATAQAAYTAFVSEFLTERLGAGPVDLSRLRESSVWLIMAGLLLAGATAQDGRPRERKSNIRVQTDQVLIHAVATDLHGTRVTGIAPSRFHLF